jgi:hypothetical protein
MVEPSLKCPPRTGIFKGAKFLLWVKVGGEMQLASVACKGTPYPVGLRNGGTAWYVDVYGYGVRASVNVRKLRARTPDQN